METLIRYTKEEQERLKAIRDKIEELEEEYRKESEEIISKHVGEAKEGYAYLFYHNSISSKEHDSVRLCYVKDWRDACGNYCVPNLYMVGSDNKPSNKILIKYNEELEPLYYENIDEAKKNIAKVKKELKMAKIKEEQPKICLNENDFEF